MKKITLIILLVFIITWPLIYVLKSNFDLKNKKMCSDLWEEMIRFAKNDTTRFNYVKEIFYSNSQESCILVIIDTLYFTQVYDYFTRSWLFSYSTSDCYKFNKKGDKKCEEINDNNLEGFNKKMSELRK